MKKITLLILSLLPLEIFAQNLSPKMAAFKEYCLNVANASASCNISELEKCIENWTPAELDDNGNLITEEKFVYKNEQINYVMFGNLQCEDTVQEVSTGIHFSFLPPAVDSWIANNCEPVLIAEANLLRAEENSMEYSVRTLKPHGKAVYSTRGAETVEMFVVAENGGKIRFSAHSVEKKISGEITNEIRLTDPSDGQSAQLIWTMNRNGDVDFSVENLTDREISFIVVKKM